MQTVSETTYLSIRRMAINTLVYSYTEIMYSRKYGNEVGFF